MSQSDDFFVVESSPIEFKIEPLPLKEYESIKRSLDGGTRFALQTITLFLIQLSPETIDRAIDTRTNILDQINDSIVAKAIIKSARKLVRRNRDKLTYFSITYVIQFLKIEAPLAAKTIEEHPYGKEWLKQNIKQIKQYLLS